MNMTLYEKNLFRRQIDVWYNLINYSTIWYLGRYWIGVLYTFPKQSAFRSILICYIGSPEEGFIQRETFI